MATSLRVPAIRHLLRQPLKNLQLNQRRWAQVYDVRFFATHSAQDRVLAKYKDKLESKAKEEGHSDISELKEAYKDQIQTLRKQAAVPGATAPLTPPPSPSTTSSIPDPPPPPPPPQSQTSSSTPTPLTPPPGSPDPSSRPPPGVKTLSSFLDVPKVSTLPNEEITTLWRLRHASNPQSLHFSLPASTFQTLFAAAKKHPSFILPLPRTVQPDPENPNAVEQNNSGQGSNQAAELHYLQFGNPWQDTTTLLFTSLLEFKTKGEFASPHTTITFHSELAASHGLVLGQGTVVENRGVSVDEARWLMMCMQKFYVVDKEGEGRKEMLEMFTRGDGGFKVERLLDEAEKIV